MGKIIVEKLQEDVPKGSFYCGNGSIERMIEDSYFVTQLQHAFAFKVYDDKNNVIGYYMITFREAWLSEFTQEEIREYYSENYFGNSDNGKIPVIYIRYIAIDKALQGRGLGTWLLGYIIAEVKRLIENNWPVRLIVLSALKERYEWYLENGFQAIREEDLQNQEETIEMFMDMLQEKQLYN